LLEAVNATIQWVKKTALGFRSTRCRARAPLSLSDQEWRHLLEIGLSSSAIIRCRIKKSREDMRTDVAWNSWATPLFCASSASPRRTEEREVL